MLTEALILAGGRGTRLGELTRETPKPILPVGGKPFLDSVLWNLARYGLRRAVISTGYRADQISETLGPKRYGLSLEYVAEQEPLGTGGAVRLASAGLGDKFLVLNGDTLFDVNFTALAMGDTTSIALRRVEDVSRYGEVEMEGGRITRFAEKTRQGPGLINGGVYALSRKHADRLPNGPSSLERDLFPALAREGELAGMPSDGFFIDIGLPETLSQADRTVPAWRNKPAVLLDRDGVINVNHGYVHRPEEFEFTPDAPLAVRWLNENGYLAIVVTNQAGIAKGYYTEQSYLEFERYIETRLGEHGAHLDDVFYCPNHPTEGLGAYRVDCGRRKPQPGMILEAMERWQIGRDRAVMVGDSPTDFQAAQAAGIPSLAYEGGSLLDAVRRAVKLIPSA